jgi:hypothetical protein
MFSRTVLARHVLFTLLCSGALLGQQKPAGVGPAGVLEFPVIFQQDVTAGHTAAGTKVAAKLTVATLVNGTVFPRGAVFSGEVTESVKKSSAEPSRLSIRMDSAQWKNGTAPIKVYLTAWYYPDKTETGSQNLQYQPQDQANSPRNWNGAGAYPTPGSPINEKFPGADSNKETTSVPATPNSVTSNHRVLMKNVESAVSNDGIVELSCKRSNIKLDRLTTYVLAGNDLAAAK